MSERIKNLEQNKATVKFYNAEKGFGFIETKNGDLYFRYPGTTTPKKGDQIYYAVGFGETRTYHNILAKEMEPGIPVLLSAWEEDCYSEKVACPDLPKGQYIVEETINGIAVRIKEKNNGDVYYIIPNYFSNNRTAFIENNCRDGYLNMPIMITVGDDGENIEYFSTEKGNFLVNNWDKSLTAALAEATEKKAAKAAARAAARQAALEDFEDFILNEIP